MTLCNFYLKLLSFSLFFFIAANTVSAQNIKFPVKELGNCASQVACRAYCDDQSHRDTCTAFANKNGLNKEEPPKNGPAGDQKIMQKAKEILGCNSQSACQAICDQESNRDKCSQFAKEAGIEGGVKKVGPGGCTSEESCRAYCDSNEEECRKFGPGPGGEKPRDDRPPKGNGGPVCTTREECAAFCKNPANAEACKNVVIKGDENAGPAEAGDIGKLRDNILQMPGESQACVKNAIGADNYNKIMAGQNPSTAIGGDALQSCFAQGVKERDEKNTPTSKPDDFNTNYGPNGEQREQPSSQQLAPSQPPQVEGASTKASLLDIILDWILVR